jgi:hypothetical protein
MTQRAWVVAVAGMWALSGRPAPAQTTQPTPSSQPTVSYSEPAFGFELQVPAGWDYDRTRFQQFKDSIGLLRGRGPGGRRGLQIIVFRSFDMKPFEDWIVDFGKASAELTNSPRVDWETWRLPPRAGAILSYASKLGAVTTRSNILCLPFDPNTVWVFIYSGTVAHDDEGPLVRKEFDQIIGSLRVFYDPEEADRLAPAFDRGKALLARLHATAAKIRLDETIYTYEMTFAGKPIGYFTRQVTREEHVFSEAAASHRDAKEGLRVRERSWRFGEDGTVRQTRVDLFSSFDFESELLETQQTQLPPPDFQPQELLIRTDQAVREKDVLLASTTTNRDVGLPEPSKPISVGPVYLDQAWIRLLPALLPEDPPETYALAVYDGDTRALLTQTFKPLGTRNLDGYDGVAHAYEVRAGFVERPSLLYTDERGNVLRLESGELIVTRISRDDAERKYAGRRDEAQKRFQLRLE